MILKGDCRSRLREIPHESISCVISSPPFWQGQQNPLLHHVTGEIGNELTPNEYTNTITEICARIRWTLRPQGSLWLVLGDIIASETGPIAMPWKILNSLARDGWHIATATAWDDTVVAHLRLFERGGLSCPVPPYADTATDRAYTPLSQDFVRFCIDYSTLPGDTILDPCCGSGTVGMIAGQLKRNFIGIELEETNCQLALARCSDYCN